ncbi:MAG: hypothetical protein CV088_15630 [Nitrospira sp. LK70]|nr:hypothetical protein [Nitrospira sp. LK70]
MPPAPIFGKLPFDGGFENGGFVAFEVGLGALERRDGFVETGELLFDLGDDAILLSTWRLHKWDSTGKSG